MLMKIFIGIKKCDFILYGLKQNSKYL